MLVHLSLEVGARKHALQCLLDRVDANHLVRIDVTHFVESEKPWHAGQLSQLCQRKESRQHENTGSALGNSSAFWYFPAQFAHPASNELRTVYDKQLMKTRQNSNAPY